MSDLIKWMEATDIFKDAKVGDEYITREGKTATYLGIGKCGKLFRRFKTDDIEGYEVYPFNGQASPDNIVLPRDIICKKEK